MLPEGTYASGFHDTGNWSGFPDGPTHATKATPYYFPGDVLHSWATTANISKPIFGPIDSPNHIDVVNGNSFEKKDWNTIDACVQFLRKHSPGDAPFFLYCSVLSPHPPYTSNATWE